MRNTARNRPEQNASTSLENFPQKLYYKIGEVGEITGVPSHVLRFWEKQFPQLIPNKTRSGHRLYKKKDILIIFKIKELLYDRRFTIKGAREYLASGKPDAPAAQAGAPGEVLGRLREGLQRLHEILSRPNPFDS
jgi:DNA-binding transcriptional MerR regulator